MTPTVGARRDGVSPVAAELREAEEQLRAAGIEAVRTESRLLLAQALGVTRVSVLAGTHAPPTGSQIRRFRDLITQRRRRIPHAYLRGSQEFYGLDIRVTPAVLVPRPETESLVEFCIRRLHVARGRGIESPVLADAGTGSGCAAVAILAHCPYARAVATDLSRDALCVARVNAHEHGLARAISFVECDCLEALAGPFDLIVSNPPYIRSDDIPTLQVEIREYEPRLAIDGGLDGLDVHRKLAASAPLRLRRGGRLVVEVGAGQAGAVAELHRAAGLGNTETARDLAGVERVVASARA